MKYEKVVIKQIPDELAALTGLHKYNRSKMPSTGDFFHVAFEAGRAITGIDEESYRINILPEEEREIAKAETLKLRQNLEKLTGKDLSATSSFWEVFGVAISSDSDLVLNRANPLDVVRYHMLTANGYVAPDRESASLPEYRNSKYYCFVEKVVNDEEVSTQKIRDKARGELLKLSDNIDKMVLIGQYLEGDKYKQGMQPNTIYKMLSDYINSAQEPDNLKKFLKAMTTKIDELQFKIIVDRAIKKKSIVYKNKYYQRGQVTLGKTILDVYENLRKPEFSQELLTLQQEFE
jgi:hypothetical protein